MNVFAQTCARKFVLLQKSPATGGVGGEFNSSPPQTGNSSEEENPTHHQTKNYSFTGMFSKAPVQAT